MKIIELHLNNFLSFGREEVINFESLPAPILISGNTGGEGNSNGAGKSSLLESIYWALTGKTVRGVRAADVIRVGEKNCSVSVSMLIGGKPLVVSREYSEAKKRVVLTWQDREEEFHDSKQGTNRLLEILGMNEETLSLVCFYGKNFNTFSDMDSQERSNLIDLLAKGSKWEQARAKALEHTRTAEKAMAISEGIRDNTANSLRDIEERIVREGDNLKREKDAMADKEERFKKDIASTRTDLATCEQAVATAKATLAAIDLPAENIDTEEIKSIRESIDGLAGKISDAETRESNVRRELRTIDDTLRSRRSSVSNLTRDVKELEKETETGLCSRCEQPLPAETSDADRQTNLANLKETIRSKEVEIQSAESDYREKEAEEATHKQNVLELRSEETTLREVLDVRQEARTGAEREARSAERQVSEAEREVSGKKSELDRLERDRDALQTTPILVAIGERIKQLEEQIVDKKGEIDVAANAVESSRIERDICKYLQQAFKDIRFSVFNKTVQTFESVLNSFCRNQGLDFDSIEVSSRATLSSGKSAPKIEIHIVRGDERLALGAMSEGETQRINIACYLAISSLIEKHVGYPVELRVFDEPLSGVDFDGKQKIFEVINDLAISGVQVMVIDHDDNFASRFGFIIKVVKENGVSRIEIA